MAAFVYQAVDPTGKNQRGVIEAASVAGARRALRDRNLLPISVEGTSAKVAASGAPARPGFSLGRRAIGSKALATATRQLATLIGSDVRIEAALELVAAQAENQRVNSLLLNVRGHILDGRSFAQALESYPAEFPEFYRSSIAAGEQASQLPLVLDHLADFVEQRRRTSQKIQMSLLYPALLAVVSLAMIVLLLIYVVPDIVRVFVSRGAELPFLTRALIAMSGAVQSFGLPVAAVAIAAGVAARYWLRVPENRLRFDRFIADRRPFRRFSRQLNSARFASTLATLLQSAVPLVDSLRGAAAVTPNRYIRSRVELTATRVREGASLTTAMREAQVFPAMLLAIAASGEASGRLGPALQRAANELERELDTLVAVLVALVEPAVLLLMGGIVLLMVLSILLPIMNLNNLVSL